MKTVEEDWSEGFIDPVDGSIGTLVALDRERPLQLGKAAGRPRQRPGDAVATLFSASRARSSAPTGLPGSDASTSKMRLAGAVRPWST